MPESVDVKATMLAEIGFQALSHQSRETMLVELGLQALSYQGGLDHNNYHYYTG